jgi:glycosyltransferase involved in cell wall biosynthesis
LIRARNYYLLNNRVIPICDGVVCISSYLADIHSKAGKRTVIIPPLAVEKSTGFSDISEKDHTIRFVYAGTTSDVNRPTSQWKDRIDIMFENLRICMKDPSLRLFHLNVYGMTEEQYIEMFPIGDREASREVIKELDDRVSFIGSVPNQQVMEAIRQADFTILIRDKKRATMSGFPTKVSESITCGTPVLCNDTSDIKAYVVDGETGFVVDDVYELFVRALKTQRSDIIRMKNACSNNPFYYRNFSDAMKKFLKG